MELRQIKGEFSIAQYDPAVVFQPLYSRNFCSITRTQTEVTIVCETDLLPPGFDVREDGWACLEVDGVMTAKVTKVISQLAHALAGQEISLFAVSTYNTDYVLVKAKLLKKAGRILREMGIPVR